MPALPRPKPEPGGEAVSKFTESTQTPTWLSSCCFLSCTYYDFLQKMNSGGFQVMGSETC